MVLDLAEAVEVELADEAFKLGVPEEEGSDLGLHKFGVEDVDIALSGVPGDYMGVGGELTRAIHTLRIFWSL